MAIVFIPSLVALLESKENEAGCELTQSEVESIRDNATTVELPSDIVDDMAKAVAIRISMRTMSGMIG
ncbi:hypothetical protein [Providencia rettgeri]|uniref:hypothetical protein n=1 Tax=Providencia rettgeri TaxID=587 RepID=UPI003216E69A